MHTDSVPSVMILGANGRFGRAALDAFSHAGWKVIAQSRSAPVSTLPPNASSLIGDALDTERMIEACGGNVDVIVNGLNPVYTDWEHVVPRLTDSVLRLARETGALLMLPGNVYNFGRALPAVLAEDTPQVADTSKAAIRIAVEKRMQAAAAEGVRSVVIRAGDFFGGAGPGTWIDMVIATKLQRGKVTYPGPADVPHAWAYLPDLAQVFVAVAERRHLLQPFEVFHYAGRTLTGAELFAALERAAGTRLRLGQMPWWLLKLASPVVPMFRALLEMRYLWDRPHRLDETKLANFIGEVPRTPLDRALQECLPEAALRPGPAVRAR